MLKNIALASVLAASACADDGVEGTPGPLPTEQTPDVGDNPDVATASLARQRQPNPDTDRPVCGLLPQDDSACAHACDPDALAGYIPEGTCATFKCTLQDGTLYVTGGCN